MSKLKRLFLNSFTTYFFNFVKILSCTLTIKVRGLVLFYWEGLKMLRWWITFLYLNSKIKIMGGANPPIWKWKVRKDPSLVLWGNEFVAVFLSGKNSQAEIGLIFSPQCRINQKQFKLLSQNCSECKNVVYYIKVII